MTASPVANHIKRATGQSAFQRYASPAEREAVNKLIDAALAAGYVISVNDDDSGHGDWVLKRSRSKCAIQNVLATTCGDLLLLRDPAAAAAFPGTNADRVGWLRLIWGNDGDEVLNDYSDNERTRALVEAAGLI